MSTNKILIISQNFYPEVGSAGNRIKNIYTQLQRKGHDVYVLTTEPTYPDKEIYGDEQFWDDEGLNADTKINRVKVANKTYSRNIVNRLVYYLKIAFKMLMFILKDKHKYEAVLVTSPPIFTALVGLVAKYRFRSRLILDVRDLWPESLKGVKVFNYSFIISIFRWLEKRLYKGADQIIVNSEGFISYIKKAAQIKDGKITFVPNAANNDELAAESREKGKKFKVIYAGNIGMAQDVDMLINLAGELEKQDIQLSVIGYGVNRKKFAEECYVKNFTNISIYNPLSRKECLKIMAEHHAGIVTLNNSDVFKTVLPGKVIDYMTCGVPVIASVSGFSKQTIEKAKVGFVSEERNVSEMINYILYLKNNPSYSRQASDNGKAFVKDNFLWEKNIDRLTWLVGNKQTTNRQADLEIQE
ncbi:glycosyltransferase family 4 protein [Salipaludibacillus sp. CUR1]|uniref:glycosyltransferase family 4 protein n=1 Tax=Salipaludibacillus sp. CUR1 TaxID=2820003 RepID=UPI001E3B4544|nr:glycosyltransferase family 4 protein [Salipaludibacillus sp. CUR1]MCE7791782.1 glycosyltransferase family 4 protein [Salipaludibacillus sp. CUR1]